MRIIVAMCLALPGLAFAGQSIDERTEMDPRGKVTVINIAGDIEIETWERSELELTGELGDDSELTFDVSGGNVRIEVEFEDKGRHRNYAGSDLYLRVPVGASLSVSAVSSDIEIRGTRGESVVAETVSGDLDLQGEPGRADLSSVSGDVTFRGRSSRTSVESVSGDIELDGLDGELEVSLVSGDVELNGGTFTLGRFESVSGSLELTLTVADSGRVSVETMSGDAILNVPNDQKGEFRAQTFSGDIRSRFGSPQREKHGPGSRLKHVEGNGGAMIRVESFSGDVRIGQK